MVSVFPDCSRGQVRLEPDPQSETHMPPTVVTLGSTPTLGDATTGACFRCANLMKVRRHGPLKSETQTLWSGHATPHAQVKPMMLSRAALDVWVARHLSRVWTVCPSFLWDLAQNPSAFLTQGCVGALHGQLVGHCWALPLGARANSANSSLLRRRGAWSSGR